MLYKPRSFICKSWFQGSTFGEGGMGGSLPPMGIAPSCRAFLPWSRQQSLLPTKTGQLLPYLGRY